MANSRRKSKRCALGVVKVNGVRSPGGRCKRRSGPKRSKRCPRGVTAEGVCAKKPGPKRSRRSSRRSRKSRGPKSAARRSRRSRRSRK